VNTEVLAAQKIVAKRRQMGVNVNDHPRYTEYLRQGQQLGLGVADPDKIERVSIKAS
jgi:hypothetical protein